jgi:hypothetical protein
MKRLFFIILCCISLWITNTSVMADTYIDYSYTTAPDSSRLTTSFDGAIVDTFDSDRPGWDYYGGAVVSGSVSGNYAAPYLDVTNFFAVNSPLLQTGTTATVFFGGAKYNYLGLYWGSVDTYNKIEFFNGENIVAAYTGLQIDSPANGNQSSLETNLYVNFYHVPEFDQVRFISTSPAFEIDNLAVGHAPVPGALLLGLFGIVTAGIKLRKSA